MQHSVATLLRHCFDEVQHCSNIATMCCAKNCRYESSRLTSPLHPSDSSQPLNFVSKIQHGSCTHSRWAFWHFHTLNKHLFLCVGILVHMSNTGFRPFFAQKKFKDFSRAFKDLLPIFQGLHSVQKRALFFHNMSNFIPKVFLCSLLSPWSST